MSGENGIRYDSHEQQYTIIHSEQRLQEMNTFIKQHCGLQGCLIHFNVSKNN